MNLVDNGSKGKQERIATSNGQFGIAVGNYQNRGVTEQTPDTN